MLHSNMSGVLIAVIMSLKEAVHACNGGKLKPQVLVKNVGS